jgi:hypothetical protein
MKSRTVMEESMSGPFVLRAERGFGVAKRQGLRDGGMIAQDREQGTKGTREKGSGSAELARLAV